MKINISLIHYALAIAGLKGISLLMLPVITRFLTPESYGTLNFLVSISAMLSIFLGFGLAEVVFRFAAHLAKPKLDAFIAQCVKLTFLISSIFILCAYVGLDTWLSLLPLFIESHYFMLLMVNLALITIQAIYLTRYRVLQQSSAYMYVALSQGITQALLTYALLAMEFGVLGVLLSGCITSCVVTLWLVIHHRALLTLKSKALTRGHLRYGAFIALSALCLYGLGGAENWFIAAHLGPSQLAYFFIATQFSLALSLAFEPFRLWWFPIRFKRYFANRQLAASGAVNGCLIITVLALTMITFAPFAIEWLLPESYHDSQQYIGLLCLILVIKTYAELLNLGCYLEKNVWYVPLINGVSAIFSLIIIASFVTKFGIAGVFTGLLVGHSVRLLAFYFLSQRISPLAYRHGALGMGLSTVLIALWLDGISIWLNVVLLLFVTLLTLSYMSVSPRSYQQASSGGKYEYS